VTDKDHGQIAGLSGPLRICLMIGLFRPAVGGEERHAERLGGAFVRRGHRVWVATQRLPGTPAQETHEGVRVERVIRTLSWGPLFGMSYALTAAWFLSRGPGRFDIVQTTSVYWEAVVAALLKPLLRARLIVRVVSAGVGGDIDKFCGMRLWPLFPRLDRPTLNRFVRLVLRRADALIVLTGADRAELLRLGVDPARCHVVPNGVATDPFVGCSVCPRRRSRPQIICVARLAAVKGLDLLLQALPAVRAAVGPVALTVLGEGPERPRLEAMATRLGLSGVVRLPGSVEDVAQSLATADLFVLPSRREAMPLALLEAMAAALPVVATRVGAIPEVLSDGVNGLLVEPEDPADLATAIVRIIRDQDLACGLGRAARRTVVERYSMEGMVQRTLDVYQSALARASTREQP
jgi:glycosyltransferase involved in cell wall biosynthesis